MLGGVLLLQVVNNFLIASKSFQTLVANSNFKIPHCYLTISDILSTNRTLCM